MFLKLDVSKAYDRVDWSFLLKVLNKFGFNVDFISIIEVCISSTSFSMFINRGTIDYFLGRRGLRQGDPLSLCLFIIMMEALGKSIQQ